MKTIHTQRGLKRVQTKGAEYLRELCIAYVFHSFERSAKDKKKMFEIQNAKWVAECFRVNKKKKILNPLGFKNMIADKKQLALLEEICGVKKDSIFGKIKNLIHKVA